jgi:hypothetical protein
MNPNNYLKFPVTEQINIMGNEESEPTDEPRQDVEPAFSQRG